MSRCPTGYRKVHVQLAASNAASLLELCREKAGLPSGRDPMDAVVSDLAGARPPRLEYPVYISAGESEGDLVEVPYGPGRTAVGLALEEVGRGSLDPGVEYKPVLRVLARRGEYEGGVS